MSQIVTSTWKRGQPDRRREGSALIMALFVIVVLAMLVGSFGFEAHLEAKYASYAKNRIKASQLAESGMVIAEMLMGKQGGSSGSGTATASATTTGMTKTSVSQTEDEDRWADAAERLKLGQSIYGLVEPVGEGFVILDIVPEGLHQRVSVVLGSKEEVEYINRLHQ